MKSQTEIVSIFTKARDFARSDNHDLAYKYFTEIIEDTKELADNSTLMKSLPRVYYHCGVALIDQDKIDDAKKLLVEMKNRFSNLEYGAGLAWIDGLDKFIESASEFMKVDKTEEQKV